MEVEMLIKKTGYFLGVINY